MTDLVPLTFAPYAEVVADRAKALFPQPHSGNGSWHWVVTEALARILPPDVMITATRQLSRAYRARAGSLCQLLEAFPPGPLSFLGSVGRRWPAVVPKRRCCRGARDRLLPA